VIARTGKHTDTPQGAASAHPHMPTTSDDVLTISHDHHPDTRIARDHSHAPRDTFPPTATLARPHHSEIEFASNTVRTDRPPTFSRQIDHRHHRHHRHHHHHRHYTAETPRHQKHRIIRSKTEFE
jgi:hypothetical protein